MKKTLLLFAALFTSTCATYAQKSSYKSTGKTVGYRVLLDNPDMVHPVFVALDILTADTWNTSSYMGYGLRGDFNARRYGSISFDYRKGYLGSKQRATELGGSLNLFSSRKKSGARVVLSSSSIAFGSKMIHKSSGIDVPAIKKTVLQARGGIASFRAPIEEAPDGNVRKGEKDPRNFYMTNDTNNVIVGFGKGYKGVYGFEALMKMNIYYVGLSVRTIKNVVVAHDNGVSSNSNNYNFFVDVLTGGDPRFTDVDYTYTKSALGTYEFPVGTVPEQYSLSNNDIKTMGWRAGWEAKTNAGMAISYKVEFGSRPGYRMGSGILSANSYLLLAAGISISAGNNYKKMAKAKKDTE